MSKYFINSKKTTYTISADQLADLDKIRQSLYMLSMEDLPRPVDEQIHVAAYRLYYWLQQFEKPVPLKDMKRTEGDNEWPTTHKDLWEAHK